MKNTLERDIWRNIRADARHGRLRDAWSNTRFMLGMRIGGFTSATKDPRRVKVTVRGSGKDPRDVAREVLVGQKRPNPARARAISLRKKADEADARADELAARYDEVMEPQRSRLNRFATTPPRALPPA